MIFLLPKSLHPKYGKPAINQHVTDLIILFFVILISQIFFVSKSSAQTIIPPPFHRFQEKILVMPGDTLLELKNYFIIPGSDSLSIKNRLLKRAEDYKIDLRSGKIHLFYQPVFPESLSVVYQIKPVNLKPVYQHIPFLIREKTGQDSLQNKKELKGQKPGSDLFDDSQLRKSGSITRSLTVGNNQGLRLDSGLRLQLEGKITSDVEVIAALSDQNTPIQPEGNTQSLQEIDKVFIRIQSPNFRATFGDFNISYQAGRFGNYSRKLQGAQLLLKQGTIVASVSGAVSKGKFRTMQFKGEEGKQGPYQLRSERGQTNIIVLAGTERVWIDGELMTRGEENDYVIEYGSGQITFTRKRLVTGDSRIEIDFEYSDLRFQRNLYSANIIGSGWNNRLKFKTSLIRESDDKNRTLEADIGDKEKETLSGIGDDLEDAFVESGIFLGEGKGNYVKSDSAGIQFFRYVGVGNGDYSVRFSYVGDQTGEYRYIGSGRYYYEGQSKGNYTPRRYLPVPQSQNLGAFFVQLNPLNSTALTAELAMSQTDRNLYSSADDGDNFGTAFQFSGAFNSKSLMVNNRQFGTLQLSGLWRRQDKRFFEITRNREVEYDRKWDLPEESFRGEVVQELNGSYSPWQGVKIGSDFGNIKKGELFQSRRELYEFSLKRSKLPDISFREEFIKREDGRIRIRGNWRRRLAQFQYQIWKFRPNFRYEFEDKQDRSFSDSLRTGFIFDDLTAGLALQIAKPLEISFARNSRHDQTVSTGEMQDYSDVSSQKFGVKLSRWRNLLVNFVYTTRVRSFKNPEQSDKRTRLSDLNLSYFPLKKALQTDVRLQMSTTQISKTERVYFKVEQGRGTHRFDPDLNEYVPDIFGEYILRTFATGEFEPVNDLLINGKFRIKPKLMWARSKNTPNRWRKVLSSLSWETFFSVNEKSRRDNPWNLNFNQNGLVFPDQETVFGRYLVRQDINVSENVNNRSLRFR